MTLKDRCARFLNTLRRDWLTVVGSGVVLTLLAVVVAGALRTEAHTESLGPLATTTTPSTSPTTSTGSPAPSPTFSKRPDAPSPKPSRIIAWIRDFAPMGGGSGPHDGAFSAIVEADCATAMTLARRLAEPQRSLYDGAGAACLAAFHNQPQMWTRAEARLPTVTRGQAGLVCFDKLVYPLLRELVRLHRENPTLRLVRGPAPANSRPRCPKITDISPSHGPMTGGYTVRLTGENLPTHVRIHFGEHELTAVTTNHGTHVVVIVPRSAEATEVPVWVEALPTMPEAWFTYDPPATPRPSATSASATPPASGEVSTPSPPAADLPVRATEPLASAIASTRRKERPMSQHFEYEFVSSTFSAHKNDGIVIHVLNDHAAPAITQAVIYMNTGGGANVVSDSGVVTVAETWQWGLAFTTSVSGEYWVRIRAGSQFLIPKLSHERHENSVWRPVVHYMPGDFAVFHNAPRERVWARART